MLRWWQAGAQLAAPLRWLARLASPRSFFLEGRGGIVGKFVFAGVGALYFQFVEEERGADDAGCDAAGAVADLRVIADGDEVAAQGADIEFAEDGAADELFVAVGIHAIKQPRCVAGAEGLDAITVGLALVGDHLEDALLQLARCLGFLAFD